MKEFRQSELDTESGACVRVRTGSNEDYIVLAVIDEDDEHARADLLDEEADAIAVALIQATPAGVYDLGHAIDRHASAVQGLPSEPADRIALGLALIRSARAVP